MNGCIEGGSDSAKRSQHLCIPYQTLTDNPASFGLDYNVAGALNK
jgi:hypothetical protein